MRKSVSSNNRKLSFSRLIGLAATVLIAAVFIHALPGLKARAAGSESLFGFTSLFNWNADSQSAVEPNMVLAPGTCDTAGPIEVESSGGTAAGTPTVYATLTAAFTAINDGATHLGVITIDVCGDTTESATATLNQVAGVTSVTIAPAGGAARTISGTIAGDALITLNGADAVTINGLNSGGNSLTLSNLSNSSTSGTSTVKFIGDATGNTVTNSSILGSATISVSGGTNGGNVWFAAGAVATGNDNNTISNCNIGPAGANLPTRLIWGNGSTTNSTVENSGITVTNNNLFDFFSATTVFRGIDVAAGNTDWTISNNRVYQTAARTFTGTTATTGAGIIVTNTSTTALGNNFQVTGNTVGFASANGTGTLTITGGTTGLVKFYPIQLQVNTSTAPITASTISGNTVAGINLTTAASGTTTTALLIGIYPQTGLINTTGNTIGSQTGTGSITVSSSSTTTGETLGIFSFASANANVSNNNIGSITATNSTTGSMVLTGIRTDLVTAATSTVSGNNIGGTTAGSLTNSATGTASRVVGIIHVTGISAITGNTVRNGTMSAANVGTGAAASVAGISQTASAVGQNVSQNTIFNLSNTNATAAVNVLGISHSGATTGTTNLVSRNFVYNLSTPSTAGVITGINASAGVQSYQNNMVDLGNGIATSAQINGMNESGGTNTFFHNSVYIGGTGVTGGTVNTFAFNSSVTTTVRSYRDNIFYNARSNASGTGNNFAIQVGGTAANPAGLTSNNNILFADGTGGAVGRFNATTQLTLADWRTATGQDANSFSSNPQYVDPTNTTTPDLHLRTDVPTIAEGNGADVGVTIDFDGQTRATLTPTDIGADAGNFILIDVSAPIISYTPLANTASTANRTITVTITDQTGVATGGNAPRIYFKKSTDANYVSTQCVLASGTAQNGTYTCTINYSLVGGGSVASGDTIQYFVVAQDTVGNVGANPSAGFSATSVNSVTTPPTTPNSYQIVGAFPATVNVGTGQTYTSLTGATGVFAALNAGALAQNTTINITSDLTEDGTVALNQLAQDGGTFTLTIQPDAATERLISGAVANGMIRLNGADNVIFDGRFGGTGKFLRFRNTNAANPTFTFLNDATNNTIRSSFVESANATATTGTIFFGTSTGTLGNSNNTIQENEIRDISNATGVPANGIVSNGSATALNGSNNVLANFVYNFSGIGVAVGATGAGNGWSITSNSAYQTAARTTALTGYLVAGGSGHTITNNFFGGNAAAAGSGFLSTSSTFRGFDLAVGTASPTSVQNNVVRNIRSTSTAFTASYGIFLQAGTANIGNVTGNYIGSTNVAERIEANGDNYGIRTVSTTAVNLSNNTVNNMTTASTVPTGEFYFGISVEGTGGVNSIINNTVTNVTNGSTPDSSFNSQTIGIVVQATGIQTVRGNTVSNVGSTSTTATTALNNRVFGLVISAVPVGSVVDRNRVANIYASSPSTGARVDVVTALQSQGAGSAVFSNNMVTTNGGADGVDRVIYGILEVSTGTDNFYHNSVNIYGTAIGANNTYAFNRNSAATNNVRNNIFVNNRTGGTGFHVAEANTNASATGFTSNYNILDNVDPTTLFQNLGAAAANNRTLAQFRTETGQDLNSQETDPLFVSNTDLHIQLTSPAINAGVVGTGITTDFDNQTRDAQPDIGADEIAFGTIVLSSATYTVGEGDGTVTITVNRTGGSQGAVSVPYTLTNGATNPATGGANCSTAGVDYVNAGGTVNFIDGQSTATFTVQICQDAVFEGNETFNVNLGTATGGATVGTQSTAVVTIIDDKTAQPGTFDFGAATYSVLENAGSISVPVNRSNGGNIPVTVSYSVGGTATGSTTCAAGVDYITPSGTLVFNPGDTTQSINITICDDAVFEPSETIVLTLTGATNGGTIGTTFPSTTITINDDQTAQPGTLQFSAANYPAPETGAITITVNRTGGSDGSVTVNYATGNGTATGGANCSTAGVDYVSTNGTLTFGMGVTSQTFNVTICPDSLDEANETINLTLSNATGGATIGTQSTATITIADDDPTPSLSINDVTQNEGNTGTTAFNFTVTLSAASGQTVTVNYATANGTATAPSDYAAINGTTLTFAPGETTKQVTVNVVGDTANEPDETFFVNLSGATNATIADNQGLGTITNDDAVPTLAINDVTQAEGNAGTTAFTFTVTLSAASGQTVTVNYATANGTAAAGVDYVATSGTLTFAPGDTTKQITVLVNGDTLNEADETFFVNLTAPTNATFTDPQGLGTITNDDAAGTLSINDVTQAEGNSGTTAFNFTVTLSSVSAQTVTVAYATADNTATQPSDYTATSGTLTFAPGDTTKTVTVLVNGDTAVEPTETFFVNLTAPTNATISDAQGLGTITNDDSFTPGTLSINDVRVVEGDSGTQNVQFTVTLTNPNPQPASVQYTVGGGTATAGVDYTATPTSGTLNFGNVPAKGGNDGVINQTATVTVTINGDTLIEPNETFFVTLSNPNNATIGDNQGVGIIVDDDRAYTSDFDNDRKTDFTVFRPSNGYWYTLQSTNGTVKSTLFGVAEDVPVPGDYDADGIVDIAVFRPSTGIWFVLQSSNQSVVSRAWGATGDLPVQGDYDFDGRTDFAVFRPSNGTWYVLPSATPNSPFGVAFGANGDVPVQGDYDGDGKTDFAVYRGGTWFVLQSRTNTAFAIQFGAASDKPVVGDFDGDGKNDFAVYRSGTWFIYQSLTQTSRAIAFGASTDIPTPADYDGDGTSDISVFRPGASAIFYYLRSTDNGFGSQQWGGTGDKPVPAYYQPQPQSQP